MDYSEYTKTGADMETKKFYSMILVILILSLLLSLPAVARQEIEECTVGVASGRATPDGRPMIWKTRDSGQINNEIVFTTSGKYKYVAEVQTDFGDLSPVEGYPSDLNQVFLNLIINAADAIRERGDEEMGLITVRTKQDLGHVIIEVSDTGTGIPEAVRPKIFHPFFTTKGIGGGTGQGLAISYNIIAEKHNGSLTFKTTEGEGATFIIRLPTKDN